MVPQGSESQQNFLSFFLQAKTHFKSKNAVKLSRRFTRDFDMVPSRLREMGWQVKSGLEVGEDASQEVFELTDLSFLMNSEKSFRANKEILSSQVDSLHECYLGAFENFRTEIKKLEAGIDQLFFFPVVATRNADFLECGEILKSKIKTLIKKPMRKTPLRSATHLTVLLDSIRRFEQSFYQSTFLVSPLFKTKPLLVGVEDQEANYQTIRRFVSEHCSDKKKEAGAVNVYASSFAQMLLLHVACIGKPSPQILYLPAVMFSSRTQVPVGDSWMQSGRGLEQVSVL
jgi:hypothetical protein